jgi:hypothetical protein
VVGQVASKQTGDGWLQAVPVPVPFLPLTVLLGLAGHLINSIILTAIFALLVAPRLAGHDVLVMRGILYALGVFVVLWFAIVPLVDPVSSRSMKRCSASPT